SPCSTSLFYARWQPAGWGACIEHISMSVRNGLLEIRTFGQLFNALSEVSWPFPPAHAGWIGAPAGAFSAEKRVGRAAGRRPLECLSPCCPGGATRRLSLGPARRRPWERRTPGR